MLKPIVMIVEDSHISLKSSTVALQSAGYTVLEAHTAADALNLLTTVMPQVIITDISLPDMNGIMFARSIRRLKNGMDVPIILMSGFSAEIETAKMSGENFSAYLVRPFKPAKLIETVNKLAPIRNLSGERLVANRRLLIVDDDPVQLKLMQVHFANAGFEVLTSGSGERAFEIANQFIIDMIMCDVLMPVMDGFEFCHKIRTHEKTKNIPVILMTLYFIETQDQQLAKTVGANLLVEKKLGDESSMINLVIEQLDAMPTTHTIKHLDSLKEHKHKLVQQLEQRSKLTDELVANLKESAPKNIVSTFDNVSCGIEIIDFSGTIVESNKYSQKIRGMPKQNIIGHTFIEYVLADERKKILDKLGSLRNKKNIHISHVSIRKGDGKITVVDLTVAAVNHDGEEKMMAIMNEEALP